MFQMENLLDDVQRDVNNYEKDHDYEIILHIQGTHQSHHQIRHRQRQID